MNQHPKGVNCAWLTTHYDKGHNTDLILPIDDNSQNADLQRKSYKIDQIHRGHILILKSHK